ncbi:MAG: hypothetical protein ACYS9X_32240, partial [Planctomycetota bacterium]
MTGGEYLSSLARQIGQEKRSFEGMLKLSLTVALGAAGLALGFVGSKEFDLAFIVSGLAVAFVFSLFFRATRAYNNYYLYLLLKNRLVEKEVLPSFGDDKVAELIKSVDLRRSWEGDRILGYSRFRLCWHVLLHTEYALLICGLLFLEVYSLVNSEVLLSVWSGYVVLIQLAVLIFVVRAVSP